MKAIHNRSNVEENWCAVPWWSDLVNLNETNFRRMIVERNRQCSVRHGPDTEMGILSARARRGVLCCYCALEVTKGTFV